MNRQILNGWKEISNHIQRGVRTAQRWELLLGMPVHRPALKDRSAVVAFSDELDRWLSRTEADTPNAYGEGSDKALIRVHHNLSTLAWHTSELASQTTALQEQLRRSLDIQHNRIASRLRDRPVAVQSRNRGATLPFRPRNNSQRQLHRNQRWLITKTFPQ
jgi:hypothetical protein